MQSLRPDLRQDTCPLCEQAVAHGSIEVSSGSYRHCAICDLIFLQANQRLCRARERAHYLTHENHVDDSRYRAFLSQLANPLLQRLPRGSRGIDFGAGPGPALAAMLDEAGCPTAVYDPFFAPDQAVLQQRYDFVTCTEVVEHMYQPGRELGLIDRLLYPGGWLGVMTELRADSTEFAAWYYHKDPTHVCFWSAATVSWIARQYNWHIEMLQNRVILFRKS
ncbi:MAG: class I SAM-dependent methyltransferase [Woeseia sp.]